MTQNKKTQKGSILAVVMGGMAMTAVLGITTFSLMSGPLTTIISVNKKAVTQSQVEAIARIALMTAQNSADFGDSDGDGIAELPDGREGGVGISPLEYVPTSLGTPTRDPWGNDYYYCVWDMGATYTANTLHLDGADDPFRASDDANAATKLASSQTFIAVFSAGGDGVADSTCANWTNDTTSVFTCAGDDLCKKYTYAEAAKQTGGIWSLKEGDPTTITTGKNIEIGADISIDAASGDATFTTLETTPGKIIATGGLQIPLETNGTVDALCGASYEGLMRFNAAIAKMQICDGADWVDIDPASGDDTVITSEWTETSASSGHIYYNDGTVMIGTTSPGTNDLVKISSTDSTGLIWPATVTPTVNSTAGNGVSIPASFGVLPMAGATIIVPIGISNGTVTSVSDNQGNTYSLATSSTNGTARTYIYYTSDIPAPSGTFTVSIVTSGGEKSFGALQVINLTNASVVDATGSLAAGDGTTSTVTTSGSTTQASALAIAVHNADFCGAMGYIIDSTPYGTGSSWGPILTNNDSDTYTGFSTVLRLLSTTSTVGHTWTFNNTTCPGVHDKISSSIVTFKSAGIGVTPPTATNISLDSYSATASNAASLELLHAEGTKATPDNIEVGDNTGYVGFYGYSGGFKKGAQITHEIVDTTAPYPADFKFALGTPTDTLDTAMWISYPAAGPSPTLSIGTQAGTGGINVYGKDPDIFLETYQGTNLFMGSLVKLRHARGSMSAVSALNNGDMIGAMTWQGEDGDGLSSAAAINGIVNGTISNTRLDSDLVFQMKRDGTASATTINDNSLRLRGTGPIGVNTNNPLDMMHVNGIVRIVDTVGNDTYSWNGVEASAGGLFAFSPSALAIRSGYTGIAFANSLMGSRTPLANGSFSVGYNTTTSAINSFVTGSTQIPADAKNSIILSYADGPITGANSIVLGGGTNGTGTVGTTFQTHNISADYAASINQQDIVFGRTADHSFSGGGYDQEINGSYSYSFTPKVKINNANTSGNDHIFAVNLNIATPTTFSQANTMAIMNGNVAVGSYDHSGYGLKVVGTAGLSTGTTWTVPSDARLKDIKGPYKKGMRDISQLHPTRFKYKEGNIDNADPRIENVGFIAQAVQPIFPETISMRKDGYLDFNMHAINVAKVNAIKDLNARQQELLGEQEALRKEQEQLLAAYADLRREADKMMNIAGIPSLRGLWSAAAFPLLGFMMLGLALHRRRK